MTDRSISPEISFNAMRNYLLAYCNELGGDDELGAFMGSATTDRWDDGGTNDPAFWPEYITALEEARVRALRTGANSFGSLDAEESYFSMLTFLGRYYDLHGNNVMIRPLLDELLAVDVLRPQTWSGWTNWLNAIATVQRGEGVR
jgi:hypothetical protein